MEVKEEAEKGNAHVVKVDENTILCFDEYID